MTRRIYPYLSQGEQSKLNTLRKDAEHKEYDAFAEIMHGEKVYSAVNAADTADFIALAMMRETAALGRQISSNHQEILQSLQQLVEVAKNLSSAAPAPTQQGESKRSSLIEDLAQALQQYVPLLKVQIVRARGFLARRRKP